MSEQLNFKQVPFDTMYYNNLTKQGGQVLIECDPNRTVLKIIESCITKNNTVLSNAELAQWILRYYIARTKNHVGMVQVCASYLKEFFSFGGYFERFMAKVQQHDYDKFSGNEHVASYAMNAPLYKYPNLYDISPEAKRIYEEIEWPKHHQLHDHHPEHYMRCVDEENNVWMITDDEMEEFFKDKGGHPAALMALGEMVADWMAVGIEMGNTAKSWWLKNKDIHWSYGPKYTQALEACLAFAPEQLFIDQIEPIPEPPEQRTTQVSTESYAMEGWFDPVKEEGMHYTIRNFPVIQFFNKLRKEYKTSKLEHLFDVIGIRLFSANKRTIVIHKFFVPELLYLLDKYNFPNSLITTIRSNTWVGAVRPITGSVDLNYINQTMQVSLYDHQTEFLKNYLPNKIKNHLRGYLLSFEQGLGKTITSICLMEGLKKERIVIICPKNTMMETWNAHLIKFFKNNQKVWVAGYTKGPLHAAVRWIIVNYERIDEVKEFLIKNPTNNLGIIVDESHNFLRTSSQRTQQLIDLTNNNRNADILMMSGTPIKLCGVEMIPLLRVLDPYCDDEAVAIFKRTFGFNTSIANDVLSARLSRMMTRVRKDILNLPEKKESVVNVKMSTGWKYTTSQVEKQIVEFVRERQDYYNQHLQQYIEAFEEAITWLKRDPVVGRQPDFQRYLNIIDWLRESHISDARGNADIVWANQYEKDVLIPALPEDLRKKFIWSKSVVKYLPLKIKGEVIGTLLTRLRMQMTTEMLQAADIKQYVDNAVKKTVIFTSYVDTIEVAYNYFKSQGYNVAAVYGKTASELTDTIQRFQEDQSVNPLIASLKMLSTGATLTAANTVIFLNKPWRSIEYQQASDRVHRIGQDTECEIISLVLDTGKEANLSTRMEDIMQWSSDQFDQIVDQKERELMRKFFKSFASLEIPEDCVVSAEKLTSDQMKTWGDELYHGSPNDLTELKGHERASQYKNSVFLSPLKGIASIFVIDKQDLYGEENHGYRSIHWSYDVWKKDISKLNTIPDHIVVYHNAKSFNETHGESTGYLYTVKLTDEIRAKLKTFGSEDTTRECRYVGDEPLHYTSKQKITVTWETKFDPKMVKQFGPAVESFSTSLEKYEPPYNEEQMREHGYSEEIIERLKNDPVHSWRMETGIELIHREPTRTELKRIWKNWQQMTPDQKRISDRKCRELFGCDNKTLYEYLLPQYKVESPDKGVVKYPPKSDESSSESISADTKNEDRGPISESDKKKIGKYIYHGTHRDLDIKNLGIHVCKNRANTDIKAPVVYMNRTLGVASLHVVPFMIGHGSKLKNYEEHFVNLEEAIRSESPVKHVEIVHNDPDLEECSGEQTGYIYWVEAKEFLDDLYYATPEKPNDWNFVSYRQLPIAKKTEVKVTWHKKYDPDFAKKVKGGFMAVESMALLTSTPEERRLTNLAKPLYVPIGKNSWEHIQQAVGNAIDIIRTLQGRDLTLKEYAAILFHDCSVKARKSKDRHSYYSAEIARRILSKTTYFTSEDIDEICQAIEEHDEFINPNGIHSSDLSDLLASADCNPPNVAWILNKSYSRGMENGLTHEERIQNAVRYIPKKYGTHGTIVYPKMYAAFNKKAIIKMQQTFDTLTPEECERIIMDYRRRHGLKEGDLSLPDPSLESISSDSGLESQPSTEQLGSSMEATSTPSKIAQKKKKILDFICKLCDTMEPSGLNSKRYRQIIGQMNDKEFDQFMNYMKEGKWQLHIVAPNMIVNLQNEDLLKACDLIGLDLFQRVWMYDKATGRKFLTDNKYMFVKLPIRRQQQFLDEKISVPDNDRTIDGLTGQVTGDSRSCSITNPEIQILAARGLNNTLQELVNIRGGNIHGYSEFRRMLEENGEGDLDILDTGSRTRASVVGGKLLQSMMLDTNL